MYILFREYIWCERQTGSDFFPILTLNMFPSLSLTHSLSVSKSLIIDWLDYCKCKLVLLSLLQKHRLQEITQRFCIKSKEKVVTFICLRSQNKKITSRNLHLPLLRWILNGVIEIKQIVQVQKKEEGGGCDQNWCSSCAMCLMRPYFIDFWRA